MKGWFFNGWNGSHSFASRQKDGVHFWHFLLQHTNRSILPGLQSPKWYEYQVAGQTFIKWRECRGLLTWRLYDCVLLKMWFSWSPILLSFFYIFIIIASTFLLLKAFPVFIFTGLALFIVFLSWRIPKMHKSIIFSRIYWGKANLSEHRFWRRNVEIEKNICWHSLSQYSKVLQ